MIGNDIVDLDLASRESNWKRKGFLDKIFSSEEQCLIIKSNNPGQMVWNLWSRKEAAYKIYNRITKIREYFPLGLLCDFEDESSGTVVIGEFVFYTKTQITRDYIYTVAVSDRVTLSQIKDLDSSKNIQKDNGIPYILNVFSNKRHPVSITHHGRFKRIITVD